jgi:hypothetical protein
MGRASRMGTLVMDSRLLRWLDGGKKHIDVGLAEPCRTRRCDTGVGSYRALNGKPDVAVPGGGALDDPTGERSGEDEPARAGTAVLVSGDDAVPGKVTSPIMRSSASPSNSETARTRGVGTAGIWNRSKRTTRNRSATTTATIHRAAFESPSRFSLPPPAGVGTGARR